MATLAGQLSSSSQLRWAASGWIFFIVENALLSENRTWIIDGLGKEQYHALYGTCSTAAMGSIIYAYMYKIGRKGVPALALRLPILAVSFTCMSMGLVMALQSLPKLQIPVAFQKQQQSQTLAAETDASANQPVRGNSWNFQVRCPFDFTDNRYSTGGDDVRGLDRVSRHPGLWSLAMVCAGTAVLQPTLPLQLWWMGPTAVAWLGGTHTDSRYRRGLGGAMDPKYDSVTSNLPLGAMLTGRQGTGAFTKLLEELKPLNAMIAVGLAASFVVSRGRRVGR